MSVLRSGVLLDIQGIQSVDHRDRGIARYVKEHALAIEHIAPGLVTQFVSNSNLPKSDVLNGLEKANRVSALSAEFANAAVFHSMSPIELAIPIEQMWPRYLRSAKLVVTLYDLIPLRFPDHYLADPGLRSRYKARLELVRAADAVLAISDATARDATDLLDIKPNRVTAINGAPAEQFVPPLDRATAAKDAAKLVPGLKAPFILNTGGTDERKNVDGLLLAFQQLPEKIKKTWQLVIVCHLTEPVQRRFEVRINELGLNGQVLLTGYISDKAILSLYQGCDLFVFPSRFEGYGLPVNEAMACGAPTIVANNSSLTELVDATALFDQEDPADIANSIERALVNESFREFLFKESAKPQPTWDDVATKTVDVYKDLLSTPAAPVTRKPRIAFVTPLPPTPSGIAKYSENLIPTLESYVDVDVFVEGVKPEETSFRSDVFSIDSFDFVERMRGGYDNILYSIGNSEFHTKTLALLRRHRGAVLAHDVKLTGLYALSEHLPEAVPSGFYKTLHDMYPQLPAEVGKRQTRPDLSVPTEVLMTKEVVSLSTTFLTNSKFAAKMAASDAAGKDKSKVQSVCFNIQGPHRPRKPDNGITIASFGFVNEIKQPELIIDAFAKVAEQFPKAKLVFAGPLGDREKTKYSSHAKRQRVKRRVKFTDEIPDAEYENLLAKATIAIQLRKSSNGESSAATGNCLAVGIPTISTDIGSVSEINDDTIVKVSPAVTAYELAEVITDLLNDDSRRGLLTKKGLEYAEAHNSIQTVEDLMRALKLPVSV